MCRLMEYKSLKIKENGKEAEKNKKSTDDIFY